MVKLPAYEEKIQCLKPNQTGSPDKLIWLGTKSGEFSTKSGYYTAIEPMGDGLVPHVGADFSWKKHIWDLDVAPKIKLFSWKLIKGAIPVGERLNDRHVQVNPLCKIFGGSESITHLFFHCHYAQKVWRLAPFLCEMDSSRMVYLVANCTSITDRLCLPPAGVTSGSLTLRILWNIWKAWNKFVFEGVLITPKDSLSVAISLAREWSLAKTKDPPLSRRVRPQLQLPPGL